MLSNPYSGLEIDSITPYESYINKAVECGMNSIAFTEHGSILKHVEKKQKCEKAGVKYIHGEEFYVTEEILQEPTTDEYKKELIEIKNKAETQQEIDEFIESNKRKVRDNYHCIFIQS